MLKQACWALPSVAHLSLLACGDTSGTSDGSADNAASTTILASAEVNDASVSSTTPANLHVDFFTSAEPRVTFEMSIDENPSVSVVALVGYGFLEARSAEVEVTEIIHERGANLFLAGQSKGSGRLRLELVDPRRVEGTLLAADERLTFSAAVSISCAVPDSQLPESGAPAPEPTDPSAGEVLVYDAHFESAKCGAVHALIGL
jgi:hypothetical protein